MSDVEAVFMLAQCLFLFAVICGSDRHARAVDDAISLIREQQAEIDELRGGKPKHEPEL